MQYEGKTHLNYVIICPADHVGEGDAIFASHKTWLASTHHKEGEKAMLSYVVSKGPEIENPFDPSSKPTGATVFVLDEVYETPAGVANHFQMASGAGPEGTAWSDFGRLVEWLGKCKVTGSPISPVINSLW